MKMPTDEEMGIQVLDGLEYIRRRPGMYIGPQVDARPTVANLIETVLASFVRCSRPTAAHLTLWADGAATIAMTGEPLSISSVERVGVSHPAFYGRFMYQVSEVAFAGTCLNALTARLVVWCESEGHHYLATFARGGVTTLLSQDNPREILGTLWMTFLPDMELFEGGALDARSGAAITSRIAAAAPEISLSFEDRTREPARWR